MSIITCFLILVAYLLGSISSAVIFCRFAGLPDPREHGSHNPGATNVLRIGGKLSALGVLLADMLKGLFPVSLALYLGLSPTSVGFVALMACIGHIFPIFFGFRGGKGVATALGAILSLHYEIAFCAVGIWFVCFLLFGYVSLSSVIATLLVPALMWYFKPEFTFPVALLSCLLLYRHHDNIQRLWRGQEERLNKKSLFFKGGIE